VQPGVLALHVPPDAVAREVEPPFRNADEASAGVHDKAERHQDGAGHQASPGAATEGGAAAVIPRTGAETIFGSYEITLEGRVLHGNVALKEHHIVERDGDCFLLRVADMAATPVAPALARLLASWSPSPGTLVPDGLMQALRGARLVAEEASHEAPTPLKAAAAKDAEPNEDQPAPGAVASITIFLAQSCNLACSYCYGQAGTYGGSGLMSAGTARAAVDWLLANSGSASKVHVGFFGGEPLLNLPVLKEVVAYAKERSAACGKEVGFGITTNATLVDEQVAAYIAAERIEPLVSCDGPAEVHDRQRPFADGRGSHAAVTAGAARLREAFPGLPARAALCDGADPFAVRRGLEEAGFARCSLTLASPVLLEDAAAPEDPAAREAATARMLAYRRAEVAELFRAIVSRTLDSERFSEALSRLAGLATGEKRHATCGVGRGMRAVAVDGGIYPCHRFVGLEEARMGELGSYRSEGLNDYHRAAVENLPECRTCWARYFCGGGCFYENLARTGDMHRPDPLFCAEQRAVTEDLIAGWCALDEEGKAYVRERIAQADRDLDQRP